MKTHWLTEARPQLRRAAMYGVIALAGLIVASIGELDVGTERDITGYINLAGAAVFAFAGIAAVRAAARSTRLLSRQKVGDTRGTGLGFIVQIFGYSIVVLTVLGLLDVEVSGLLLGGAITGVVLGIAAQQTLANFFAGMVLISVRPLEVGEHVVLRSGPLAGEYEGTVTDLGMFYVDMLTERGPVKLPNAGVLAAAIGPGARTPKDEEPDEVEEEQAPRSEGGA